MGAIRSGCWLSSFRRFNYNLLPNMIKKRLALLLSVQAILLVLGELKQKVPKNMLLFAENYLILNMFNAGRNPLFELLTAN